ncbi:hypothetical protein PVOR_24204 [Paenibacillus vortex V453]|uniref:Uncharacterized protein n=1 Tax=Paenibacillus vortex V453 TaxID=715225 RepID=A0A2R9SQ10_9BACL|nr:hypothetical protein PVOR_24204 [Paenibacillus vortex V453]
MSPDDDLSNRIFVFLRRQMKTNRSRAREEQKFKMHLQHIRTGDSNL